MRYPDEDQLLALSKLELHVLNALLVGRMSGYSIRTQCATDTEDGMEISNGALYPALKKLVILQLIEEMRPSRAVGPGKPKRVYQITSFGKEVLGWRLRGWQRLIDQVRDRSRPTR